MSHVIKYPSVSVDTTQARGFYEVYVSLAENISISVTLNRKQLLRLQEDINSIIEFEKEFRVNEEIIE